MLFRSVKKLLPATKIVVVTMSEDGYMANAALREWASGYLTKTSAGSELLKAIAAAMNGNRYLAPRIADQQFERFLHNPHRPQPRPLTSRQLEVLRLLAGGRSMKEAAADLKVAARTIAFHKYAIMREYGLRTNFEAPSISPHALVQPKSSEPGTLRFGRCFCKGLRPQYRPGFGLQVAG